MDPGTITIIIAGTAIVGVLTTVITLVIASNIQERNVETRRLEMRVSELQSDLERSFASNERLRRKLTDAVMGLQNLTKHLTEEDDGE